MYLRFEANFGRNIRKIKKNLALHCTYYNDFKSYMQLLLMHIVKPLNSSITP